MTSVGLGPEGGVGRPLPRAENTVSCSSGDRFGAASVGLGSGPRLPARSSVDMPRSSPQIVRLGPRLRAVTDWIATRRRRAGIAEYQWVAMLDRVRAEVAEAYARTHARYAQIGTTEQAVRTGTDGFREDLDRIRGAVGLPIEVLNNLNLLARARMEYLDSIVDYNEAQFQLFVALGQPPADALAHPVPTAGVVPRGQPIPTSGESLPPDQSAGSPRTGAREVRRTRPFARPRQLPRWLLRSAAAVPLHPLGCPRDVSSWSKSGRSRAGHERSPSQAIDPRARRAAPQIRSRRSWHVMLLSIGCAGCVTEELRVAPSSPREAEPGSSLPVRAAEATRSPGPGATQPVSVREALPPALVSSLVMQKRDPALGPGPAHGRRHAR